jgi:(E)-4-hydroxy-3-methylbut-2-enyl-diphosphate synthase
LLVDEYVRTHYAEGGKLRAHKPSVIPIVAIPQ